MSLKVEQKKVDEWAQQFKIPYWKPHEVLARLTEEVGELAREINARYGPKVKKPAEETKEIADELGDIIFTSIIIANSMNIDLDEAFEKIMDKCYGRDNTRYEKKLDLPAQSIQANSLKEYQEACKITAKKFDNPEKEILTWGLGIAGEAGDVASCIKKTFAHDNDQKAGIKENIGDTLWYSAMICNFFGWDFQEILNENLEKLKKRFPNGFTTQDAARNGTMIDWNK